MAASDLHFLLRFCFFFYLFTSSYAERFPSEDILLLPVTKDVSTLQYVTNVQYGTPLLPTKLVVDLGGPLMWINCDSDQVSSSRSVILSGSIQCLAAKPNAPDLKIQNYPFDDTAISKSEHEKICHLLSENRVTKMGELGELVDDSLALQFIKRSKPRSVDTAIYENILFSCAPISLLKGLASGSKGMLGLGRTRVALPSHVASALSSKLQFSLCLSSTDGIVLFEKGYYDSYFGIEISRSIMYTPLIASPDDSKHDYFINLQSLIINGRKLSLNMNTFSMNDEDLRGVKLSTLVPYSTMESSIYAIFVKAFEKAAMTMNMKRVEPVAPFGLCLSSKSINSTLLGPDVPVIELVLQSKLVKWKIYGRNSMVHVSKDVMCLGFLDGGLNSNTKIVLGGHQLEDVLLHFDVGASMLGFSDSLLMKERSCSDFHLQTMPIESL